MVVDVISALPPKTASLLEQLCAQANKQTGIAQPKDFERFCKFAIMAHEQNVNLPEDALRKYFEDHGWSAELADAAAKRYKAACMLLQMYDNFRADNSSF